VKKVGEEKASWCVGWYDPDGKRRCKSFGRGAEGKKHAFRYKEKVEGQLREGTYKGNPKVTWAAFRAEYDSKVLPAMSAGNSRATKEALAHFERLVKPAKVMAIKPQTIADYVAKRRQERGRKKGEQVSPATVNKELRHLRAVLNYAAEWNYLPAMPKVRMLREPGKLPRYITPDAFAAIYKACDHASKPADIAGIDPANWWRALVVFLYMTGWRVGEAMALGRPDLDGRRAITRAADNKGNRDEAVDLHPIVLDHLARLPSFDPHVFPWNHDRRTLFDEFDAIQAAAGIRLPCSRQHEHTDACHFYGFHDFRRAFATQNAKRMTGDALQKLMRHKSYLTTQRYINMASQLEEAVQKLHVPDVLAAGAG
jgi:integrase